VLQVVGCFEDPGMDGDGSATTMSETSSEDGSDTDTTDGSETDTTDTTTGEIECGDGIVQAGEACDDGNASELDMCTTSCVPPEPPVLELSFSPVKQFDFDWDSVPGADHYQLLESRDGMEPFMQIGGDIMAESISIPMPLHFRTSASYMLRACDAETCLESESVDVMSNLAEAVGYVKASNSQTQDIFGSRWAMSGDGTTLVVSAYQEDSSATGIDGNQDDNSAEDSGAVYVFVLSDGVWSQQAYIKASNANATDAFGYSVAVSSDGNTVAVGAVNEASGAVGISGNQLDNSAYAAGAVYVFVRNGDAWSQQAYIKGSNTQGVDVFGSAVALSSDGNTLAASALGEDSNATGVGGNQSDNSVNTAGAVYVFTRSGTIWTQQAYVKSANTDVLDNFGQNLALSGDGDTLVVSAPYEDGSSTGIGGNLADNGAGDSGAAYVYVRNGSVWSHQAYIKASNTAASDAFGWSLALSSDGDTLAVGAVNEDSSTMVINGDPIDNSAIDSGAVYVYTRSAGIWTQQAYVKASNTGAGDWFGNGVALSGDGDVLAVGARQEDGNSIGIGGPQQDNSAASSGGVYVFVRDAGNWASHAYIKASNTGGNDTFGSAVSLSSDASTLAVGAPNEDSSATGIGGVQTDDTAPSAGAVYLY
jgi:cysteine-rich repeat protein